MENEKGGKKIRGSGALCEDGNKCSVHIRHSRSFWGQWPNKHVAWLALATDVFQLKAVDFITLFVIVEEPEEVEAWTLAHASGPEGFSH